MLQLTPIVWNKLRKTKQNWSHCFSYFLINWWHEATLIRRRRVYIAMICFEFSSREMLINVDVYIRSSIIKKMKKKCSVNIVSKTFQHIDECMYAIFSLIEWIIIAIITLNSWNLSANVFLPVIFLNLQRPMCMRIHIDVK